MSWAQGKVLGVGIPTSFDRAPTGCAHTTERENNADSESEWKSASWIQTSTVEIIEINAAARVKEHPWCDSQEQEAKLKQKGTSPFSFLHPCSHPLLEEPEEGVAGKVVNGV